VAARPPSIIAPPITPRPAATNPRPGRAIPTRRVRARRPFRDNPILILASILLLVAALVATIAFANRSARLSPDFLTEFVLYALSVAVLSLLLTLVFVLGRNIVKLIVEQRRALPFARFRTKLVLMLLGMTLMPAVLVLLVGSELIRNNIERWFNAPLEEILSSASRIASDYYQERQKLVNDEARRVARALAPVDLSAADVGGIRHIVEPEVTQQRVGMVEVYRVLGSGPAPNEVSPIVDVASSSFPAFNRASADLLAERVATLGGEITPKPTESGREVIFRAAVPIRAEGGSLLGVVVASDYLTGEMAARSRRMTDAYESYTKLRVLRRPLTGVYLSFFVMVTLMIMVAATWMGLYLAKRVTRPIRRLAAAAREIGAGHLDQRVEPETADEFGALVEAFNAMAREVSASQRKLERSAVDLQQKHLEVEARRRYIETILERIATGVVSVDESGLVTTINSAAARLLGLDESLTGQNAASVFDRPDLQPLRTLLVTSRNGTEKPPAQEIALVHDGRELHLAAAVTTLYGEGGAREGTVLVLDDITPLIRAQKVAAWREVARRLAHEIKNPLTPIQLSAERLRRHFSTAPPPARALIEECTSTIVGEVESLKALVDEFSQFARMPAPKRVPTDVGQLLSDTLALYNGLFQDVAMECRLSPTLPAVQVDPEQIRRVVINLVDNAVEAMDRKGAVRIVTEHDPVNQVARIIVADNGPGIPAGEREKLFMPYYSTKRRGSGLGLAIVRRIVAEHGGSIEVGDNEPRGTKFTIELSCV
jgi:two-component system nitrogen regulation sensor histidine kinase NtrY